MKKIGFAVLLLTVAICFTACKSDEIQKKKDAYRQLGIKYMQEGNYEGAIDAFEDALDQSGAVIGESEIDTCYYKAQAQYLSGKTKDAVETYQALIAYDKKNADAYYLLGTLYLQEEDFGKAKENYDLALKYAGENYELYVAMYEQCSAAGLASDAQKYVKAGLANKGRSAEDYAQRGRIYLLLGDYDNAEAELDTALEKKSVEASLYMAQLYEAQGEDEKAGSLYESYIQENKEDPVALNSLGMLKMEKQDYEGAVECFTMALKIKNLSNEQEVRRNLIMAYEHKCDFAKAKSEMKSYVKDYPKDEEAAREYLFLQTR